MIAWIAAATIFAQSTAECRYLAFEVKESAGVERVQDIATVDLTFPFGAAYVSARGTVIDGTNPVRSVPISVVYWTDSPWFKRIRLAFECSISPWGRKQFALRWGQSGDWELAATSESLVRGYSLGPVFSPGIAKQNEVRIDAFAAGQTRDRARRLSGYSSIPYSFDLSETLPIFTTYSSSGHYQTPNGNSWMIVESKTELFYGGNTHMVYRSQVAHSSTPTPVVHRWQIPIRSSVEVGSLVIGGMAKRSIRVGLRDHIAIRQIGNRKCEVTVNGRIIFSGERLPGWVGIYPEIDRIISVTDLARRDLPRPTILLVRHFGEHWPMVIEVDRKGATVSVIDPSIRSREPANPARGVQLVVGVSRPFDQLSDTARVLMNPLIGRQLP